MTESHIRLPGPLAPRPRPLLAGAALFALALAFTLAASNAAGPVLLADNNTSRLRIVVSPAASETTRAAAAELASILSSISGASFTVETGPLKRGIFVGTAAEFPLPAFAEELALRGTHDGLDAFVILTRDDSLYLVGATATGASHAVYRFLDHLGCRWFFPAPEWEILPKHSHLVVDFEETGRPAMLARRISPGYGYFDRREGRCASDIENWRRRNLMAQSLHVQNGHAWQTIIIENQPLFDAHPEYLALVKGERRKPQLCVSNPAVRRLAVDWALTRLERQPDLDMISMETSDGLNHCECENCLAMGGVPDRAFGLANEVARAVARKFPGKLVGMLAYSDHSEPPSFALEPNVSVQIAAGFTYGRSTFDELLELWPEKTAHLGIYEYYSVWPWDFDMLPGGRANDIDDLAGRIRAYARAGATSMNCEAGNNWGLHGRGYYVASRLMWDPDTDVAALLADFYEKAFGPAAAPMRRHYERFDRGNNPLMSEHLLALGFGDLAEARDLAADAPAVLARLDHLAQYFHYVRLRWELDHLPRDDPRRKDLTLASLTWVYRTRYSYMNHWEAFNQGWSKEAAGEFGEPSWSSRNKEASHPWAVDDPVTAPETEAIFRADLTAFRSEDITEVEFSSDLVPLDPPGPSATAKPAAPRPLHQRFQRPMRYAIYSREGEALSFTIETGIIPAYRNRAYGSWTVTRPGGELVAGGRLPQDGAVHPLTVTVPSAGHYWLDYEDNGAGWAMGAAPDSLISLSLERGRKIIPLGPFRDPAFFFVPAATTRLHFFYEGGGSKPRLFSPDGELIREVEPNGKFVTVDVPPGAAGRAWRFENFAPRLFWLANAPNYLATSPETLHVPRELQQAIR